jgi:hypothetical protein
MRGRSVIVAGGAATLVLAALSLGAAPTIGPCPGRMTGGGSVFTADGLRVTHGFELHCNKKAGPNNLEVNWDGGNNFHLETVARARCTDDPAIDPGHPESAIDTYTGRGEGRYNNVRGATARWIIKDAGEPGSADTLTITVWDVDGNQVLSVSGPLDHGNHQAHHHLIP